MAVNNSLAAKEQRNPLEIKFMAGTEEVKLTPDTVKRYLVSGDPTNVTVQEIVMFMNLCKFQHLNPFLKEAYLIKYGSQPATIVTGKSALEKRAARCEGYRGFKAGVVVINTAGELENLIGTLVLRGEELVGGWCDVYVERFTEPISVTVSLEEYIGRKKDGSVNSQWSGKPATMIRKVAKMQALREAFPEDFAGMYSAEELGSGEIPEMPAEVTGEVIDVPAAEVPADDFSSIMEG